MAVADLNRSDTHTLRARYVFPVSGPPIRDGLITIAQGRITAVESGSTNAPVEDLGNVAILPGLVNAHVHLELSDVPTPLGQPGIGLVPWIRRVMAQRRTRTAAEAIEMGVRESVRLGTTSLGDITQPGSPTSAFANGPPHAIVFLELIAPRLERIAAAMELARAHLAAADGQTDWQPGLSPHAPYSVHPELLRQTVALSTSHHVPLAFHLAESHEELEWLRTGGGPFEEFLQSLDAWDPTSMSPGMNLLDYLQILARAHRALVIHGNYLGPREISFLAANRDRMAVVYCPRTHAWFQHPPYPLAEMLAAGVTVALGTDSRASSPDLSILAEMREIAKLHPAVTAATIVALGTVGGAAALGREHEIGTLDPGKWADLAVAALADNDIGEPYDMLLNSDRPVVATYYRGMRT